jgi:hypothetical protein
MRPNRAIAEWQAYRRVIYQTNEPLPLTQERECSLAFYAGMMSAFSLVSNIANRALDEDSGALEMEKFRQEIDFAAAHANLDRSTGTS